MNVEEWLKYGWDKGFCTAPVCSTHDGVPSSRVEEEMLYDGDDVCVHVVRLYADQQERQEVEENDSAVSWRASNRGWGN
jgi:hypothetical protein